MILNVRVLIFNFFSSNFSESKLKNLATSGIEKLLNEIFKVRNLYILCFEYRKNLDTF